MPKRRTRVLGWGVNADQESAYKTLRAPHTRDFATIKILRRGNMGWLDFRPNTQLFVPPLATCAIISPSRLIISIFPRSFLAPAIAYFADFGWRSPIAKLSEVAKMFSIFMDLIGAPLKAHVTSSEAPDIFLASQLSPPDIRRGRHDTCISPGKGRESASSYR